MSDFLRTNTSYETLRSTSSGWNNSAFGIEADTSDIARLNSYSPSNIATSVTNSLIAGTTVSGLYAANALENLAGIGDASQYLDVADAAGSAALNYAQAKLQRIKNLWHQKATLTVGTLIGEVAPLAVNFTQIPSLIVNKTTSLVQYLLGVQSGGDGTWGSLARSVGTEALSSILGDSGVTSSISQLQLVQSYGNVLNSIGSLIDTGRSILKTVEPLLPLLEIITNLAGSWINPPAAAEAGQKITESTGKSIQDLIIVAMEPLRKLVFNIKVSVPQLLVGAWNSLSIQEAVSWPDDDTSTWIREVFSGDYYRTVTNSLAWQRSINNALNEMDSRVDDWSTFGFIETSSELGSIMKSKFLNKVVQNYMWGPSGAVARARAYAHITDWAKTSWILGNAQGEDQNKSSGSLKKDTTTDTLDKYLNSSDLDELFLDELGIKNISSKVNENQK